MDGDGVRVKSSLLARQLIIPRQHSPGDHNHLLILRSLPMRVSLFMPRLSFLLLRRPARTMVVNPSPVLEWNGTERPVLANTIYHNDDWRARPVFLLLVCGSSSTKWGAGKLWPFTFRWVSREGTAPNIRIMSNQADGPTINNNSGWLLLCEVRWNYAYFRIKWELSVLSDV